MAVMPQVQITVKIIAKVSFWDAIKLRIAGRRVDQAARQTIQVMKTRAEE